MDKEGLRVQAATLLKIIWRGVPPDYKRRYRMTIWEQFENEIRAAAYTSSLARFVSRLCERLNADIGRIAEERAAAEALLQNGADREMLRLMREETIYLVLLVRVDNQERREEWEKKQAEESQNA